MIGAPHKPTSVVLVEGHLFDSGLINQLLDLLEDKASNFRILHWDIGPNQTVFYRGRMVRYIGPCAYFIEVVWYFAAIVCYLIEVVLLS